jgi:hypothetical protein
MELVSTYFNYRYSANVFYTDGTPPYIVYYLISGMIQKYETFEIYDEANASAEAWAFSEVIEA